jgi:hypothetical protein
MRLYNIGDPIQNDSHRCSKALPMERPRKPIPPDCYGLFYIVAASLGHSQPRGLDSGGSAGYQLLLPLWSTAGATQWPEQYFESRLIQEVLQRLRVSKPRTTPLHSQSDGMVDSYIRTVEEHLWKVFTWHQRDLEAGWPICLLAYKASTHNTTGSTLVTLVFGSEPQLSCDLLFGAY